MNNYEYKNSGIEWIGEIPKHWKRDKIFRLAENIGSGGTPRSSNENYYGGEIAWIQSGDLTDTFVSKTAKTISQDGLNNSSAKVFPKGTLLVAMYGATIGKLGIMEIEAAINQACCAIRFSSKIAPKYAYYLFLDMRNYLITQAYGGGQPNISQEVIKQQYIFYPPIAEQKTIAAYLDKTCEKIDRIISIKEKQLVKIEGYFFSRLDEILTCKNNQSAETKKSIGFVKRNIPKDWTIDRLRDVAVINDKALSSNTDAEFTLKYLDISNVNKYGIVDFDAIDELSFELAPSRARRITEKFDTIISSVRTNLQAVAYLNCEIENLICSTGFFVCRPKFTAKLRDKFLYYFLLSVYSKDYFFSNSTGVGYPAINDYRFGSIIMFIPNVEIQDEIIETLDILRKKVNTSLKTLAKQIETLKAYRKSLIHECVTGKKRIFNGAKIENPQSVIQN